MGRRCISSGLEKTLRDRTTQFDLVYVDFIGLESFGLFDASRFRGRCYETIRTGCAGWASDMVQFVVVRLLVVHRLD